VNQIPAGWDAGAHALWSGGARNDAIQKLLAAINGSGPRPPADLIAQFTYYLFLIPDYRAAAEFLGRGLELYPGNLQFLLNLAVCQSRGGDHEAAIATAGEYARLGGRDPTTFDTLAHSCWRTGRLAEAKSAGEQALALKDTAAATPTDAALSAVPADFEERRKIIAFTLWGANPRYLRGALHNALAAASIYPGWTCRFYVDSSVDAGVRDVLGELGAETVEQPAGTAAERLCRRFLVADDPAVGRFLVRDCDAVVGEREAAAVAAWIASGKPFHVMRDWWTHTDPMLAGMWGGIGGVLPPLGARIATYRPNLVETPNWDQWFLRDRVWPLVRDVALIHDRCFESRNAEPFPAPPPAGNRHVGQDEFHVRRAEQREILAAWIDRLPALRLGDDS
jgi:hypothetical protein